MEKMIISTSPHIRTSISTTRIMADVLIALAPAAIAGTVLFGLRALLIMAVCVGAAVGAEFLFNILAKKEQTVGDLSAAVTGLILALCLPVKTEIWQCVVGAVFAIVIVKCLFLRHRLQFCQPCRDGACLYADRLRRIGRRRLGYRLYERGAYGRCDAP